MILATYNILKGGTHRTHWVKLLQDHAVDLLLIQETYHHDQHLPTHLFPKANDQSAWQMVKRNGWGSAVFSPSGTVKPIKVRGFAGWVVGAEITNAPWQADTGDSLLAFSIHAPSLGKTYAYQVNKILDAIGRLANGNGHEIILGGDFNIGITHCEHPGRHLRKKELAIQTRLADQFGLFNCWQHANPKQPPAQTLRWTGNRTIPYHCDGLFVPQAWQNRLQSCTVLEGDEWNSLSDHNPVVASFL